MIVEVGHFALVLTLALALIQLAVPSIGLRRNDAALMNVAAPASMAQFATSAIAFAALMHAYIVSDFSVANVYQNSHSAKPLLYKISGVWGNHEGSMLLWLLMLTGFGAAVAAFGSAVPMRLRTAVLAVQASIAVAFTLFITLTSNPFARLDPAPFDGRGLNPILQDPALAFHPPFLYAGYVGFSIAFSFAVAALIEGRTTAAWARWVRPWTLAAWMSLTLGIAMGSWWAYYELGWGGWWFWDPVENASFMPWLAGTALLHSAIVMEKREALKVWTILLAILTFSLSLLGTFLVRSGVLSSVHAFAVDPERGTFILAIMVFFTGGSLAMFAARMHALRQGGLFAPISREGALILNNLLLTTACATVLVGTLYPLFLEAAAGLKISVGPPYFNATFVPLMVPLLVAVPIGTALAWKRGDLAAALQRLWFALIVTLLAVVATFAVAYRGPWLAPLAIGLGVWVMAAAVSDLLIRAKFGSLALGAAFARLKGLPLSAWGTAVAHFGLGVIVVGIAATSAYRQEKILVMAPKQTVAFAGYDLTFRGVTPVTGPNYDERQGHFEIRASGASALTAELAPAKRVYRASRQGTTEAGILATVFGDLYVTLGDEKANGAYAISLYFNPLVRLIWIGAVIMFLGGALSLSDRRLRVGAPRRASRLKDRHAEPA